MSSSRLHLETGRTLFRELSSDRAQREVTGELVFPIAAWLVHIAALGTCADSLSGTQEGLGVGIGGSNALNARAGGGLGPKVALRRSLDF